MNEALIIKSVFIFVSIWGVGIVMLWFRPRLEIFWKIIATLIFGFYIWFFLDEIISGLNIFAGGEWYIASLQFLKEFITLLFVNMFFFWPLVLILIFYKADDIGAEKLLKFLCILTLLLWIVFIIYFYFSSGIDKYLYENLKKIIPDAQ
jgi:hypothetical protein